MYYLSNAFSFNMLPEDFEGSINTRNIELENMKQIMQYINPEVFKSVVGHADTANVLSDVLGHKIECNRETLKMGLNDVLYVAQYIGPRLAEGTTTLPEGAKITFKGIMLYGK